MRVRTALAWFRSRSYSHTSPRFLFRRALVMITVALLTRPHSQRTDQQMPQADGPACVECEKLIGELQADFKKIPSSEFNQTYMDGLLDDVW